MDGGPILYKKGGLVYIGLLLILSVNGEELSFLKWMVCH